MLKGLTKIHKQNVTLFTQISTPPIGKRAVRKTAKTIKKSKKKQEEDKNKNKQKLFHLILNSSIKQIAENMERQYYTENSANKMFTIHIQFNSIQQEHLEFSATEKQYKKEVFTKAIDHIKKQKFTHIIYENSIKVTSENRYKLIQFKTEINRVNHEAFRTAKKGGSPIKKFFISTVDHDAKQIKIPHTTSSSTTDTKTKDNSQNVQKINKQSQQQLEQKDSTEPTPKKSAVIEKKTEEKTFEQYFDENLEQNLRTPTPNINNKTYKLYIEHRKDPEILKFFKIMAETVYGLNHHIINFKEIAPNCQLHQFSFNNQRAAVAFKIKMKKCNFENIGTFSYEDFEIYNEAEFTLAEITRNTKV